MLTGGNVGPMRETAAQTARETACARAHAHPDTCSERVLCGALSRLCGRQSAPCAPRYETPWGVPLALRRPHTPERGPCTPAHAGVGCPQTPHTAHRGGSTPNWKCLSVTQSPNPDPCTPRIHPAEALSLPDSGMRQTYVRAVRRGYYSTPAGTDLPGHFPAREADPLRGVESRLTPDPADPGCAVLTPGAR